MSPGYVLLWGVIALGAACFVATVVMLEHERRKPSPYDQQDDLLDWLERDFAEPRVDGLTAEEIVADHVRREGPLT